MQIFDDPTNPSIEIGFYTEDVLIPLGMDA